MGRKTKKKLAVDDEAELIHLQKIQSLTKERGNARRKITNTCKAIRQLIEVGGSRSNVVKLLVEATTAYNVSKQRNAELTDASIDPIQFDKQVDQHRYLHLISEVDREVDEYLISRKGDAASRASHRA